MTSTPQSRIAGDRRPITARVDSRLDSELRDLVLRLGSLVRESDARIVHRSAFSSYGKLLRPRTLLACVAYGEDTGGSADWDAARNAAIAIELAHVGSLYHDDIVDRSFERRGAPAVHRQFSVRVAALAGAHLLALSNSLAAMLESPLHERATGAALRMSAGQLREIERAGSFEVSPQEYVRNASRKSGAIFEFSAFAGGVLGGAQADEREVLRRFGRNLGIAFQLFDDLHDFTWRPESQRTPSNDLRERNYTLPVLLGCAREDSIGAELRRILRDDGRPLVPEMIEQARSLLTRAGAFTAAAGIAAKFRESAILEVASLQPCEARSGLERIVNAIRPPDSLDGSAEAGAKS